MDFCQKYRDGATVEPIPPSDRLHSLLARFEKDAEKKAADEKKLFEETMPKIFGLWESRLSTKFLTDDKVCRETGDCDGRRKMDGS